MSRSAEFRKLVNERGQTLRSKARAELLDLGYSDPEIIEIDGRKGTIDLIVEEEPEGSLRVVVQGFLNVTKWLPRLGGQHVALDGFRMNSAGEIAPLGDKEFYEFD